MLPDNSYISNSNLAASGILDDSMADALRKSQIILPQDTVSFIGGNNELSNNVLENLEEKTSVMDESVTKR